jgi:putative DNA primase/helicase
VRLHDHSPEHRARTGYPFTYDRRSPTRFLAFLESVWRDDADKDEKIALVQEFGGACLIGNATTYQRAIVSKGAGANGKGVTTQILVAAMPPESTTAIPPQEMGNEYRRAMLAGKRLNVVNELPEADIIDSEAFKAVVAGDPIVGRHIRQPPFTFQPVAGHFFAANRLPGTNDLTHGFWRRLVVLEFNRSFTTDPARNPHLAREIIDTELPAIVSWLLEGAVRLMREREYTVPASHSQAVAEWRRNADQVAQFVEERTRPLGAGEALGEGASDLYAAYRQWAIQNGHRPVAANKFGSRMSDLGRPSEHTKHGNRYPLVVKQGEGLVKDFSSSASPKNGWES